MGKPLQFDPDACPFTTLYWDFLLKHRDRLVGNPRMSLQLRKLSRLSTEKEEKISRQAFELRRRLGGGRVNSSSNGTS